MRILVTGGAGYIGRHLVQRLGQDHQVSAPGSRELDLLDSAAVEGFIMDGGFDTIVHCAVSGRNQLLSRDPDIVQHNLRMFLNIHGCRDRFGSLINIGSGAEFCVSRSVGVINAPEETAGMERCEESYGRSKQLISRIVRTMPSYSTLRVFSCIDPSEGDGRLMGKFMAAARRGDRFSFEDRYVDFISLHDLGTAVLSSIAGQIPYHDVNVVYEQKRTVSSVLTEFCTIKGIDHSIMDPIPSDHHYTGDGTRFARCGIRIEGLAATMARYPDL